MNTAMPTAMKLVTRKLTYLMFENNWCPVCGKVTEMKNIQTNLPGIFAQQCECKNNFQANYLENCNDELKIPNTYILPSDELIDKWDKLSES